MEETRGQVNQSNFMNGGEMFQGYSLTEIKGFSYILPPCKTSEGQNLGSCKKRGISIIYFKIG